MLPRISAWYVKRAAVGCHLLGCSRCYFYLLPTFLLPDLFEGCYAAMLCACFVGGWRLVSPGPVSSDLFEDTKNTHVPFDRKNVIIME